MQGSFIGCLVAQTQPRTKNRTSQGHWLGSPARHTWRLTPWAPGSCLTHVASLALSSPAETCAAGWGLPLRAWALAHSPSSGQATPEPRPAGGAELPALKPSDQHEGGEPPRGKKRQPSRVRLKPCLAGSERASSMAELQLCSEASCGRVAGARLLYPGRALPRLASLLGFLPRNEQAV